VSNTGGYPGAPPGWYPDPAGGPGQRWWDGYAWTEATVLPQLPPPPPGPATGSQAPDQAGTRYGDQGTTPPWAPYEYKPVRPADLIAHELRLSPMARLAIAFPGVAGLVDVVVNLSQTTQYRNYGHQFHQFMVETQNNQTANLPNPPGALGGGSTVVGLLAAAALAITLVWQFRAATAARSMGWPAKRTPGWGVVFWFIPIVNFWMPYQALRDCLPPGDVNRAAVARFWFFTVVIELASAGAIIGLMISTPVGVVFSIITGVACFGVLATAPPVVRAISAAHQATLNT
jgi:hypothetical protein